MAINKVGSKGIEDGSVATADFAPGTVTSAKLQDNAVTNAKLTNSSVTLTGSSVSLGGSVSFNNKFVDWQSVITADGLTGTTAVSGRGYFIDTTSAAHTITLPVSASIGDFIAIKDYAGTFATNNLTIARNGHNIQGVANDSLISTNRASLVLVYVDSTKGWLYWEEHNVGDLGVPPAYVAATGGTVTTSGDYKIHTFTGDGCFVVSNAGLITPTGGSDSVDYLVIAGGGSGGGNQGESGGAGGGGAGGYRTTFPSPGCNAGAFPITATTYPITVGGGGVATSPGISGKGTNGSDSIFSTITSTGGGAAGGYSPSPTANRQGSPGGSGGGGSGCATPFCGGAGNTPPVSPPQGNDGGDGSAAPTYGGGGGGGASAVGQNSGPSKAGDGGAGSANLITGSSVTRAGGGGGGSFDYNPGGQPAGSGGSGGGGPGGTGANVGTAGTSNTGSGGGGAGGRIPNAGTGRVGGNGGKGIVIIRYKFQ